MKYRSRKAKPPVGMEMTATLSMKTDQGCDEAAEALVEFFGAIAAATNKLSAA